MNVTGGNTAKRHHFVPQSLLRGFATDSEQITAVRLNDEHSFSTSVRKAAAQNHFYRVDVEGQEPDAFEKILSGVEGDAARIVRQIVEGQFPLDPDDRMALAYFIAIQVVRGPDTRRDLEHTAAQVIRMQVGAGGRGGVKDWPKRRYGADVSDEQASRIWDEVMQPGGAQYKVSALTHIKHIVSAAQSLLPCIVGRPWSIHRFKQRSLITSDVPVNLVSHPDADDEDEDGAPWVSTGFLDAWGITFPLTRKVGLLMSDPMVVADLVPVEHLRAGRGDMNQVGTAAMEKFFNENTASGAREWIYHHPDDVRFVPTQLPESDPLGVQVVGDPIELD
ncbi:DUF4238 domain-containing protein [Microbacterium sp.]|uniref:DUF4238 domain-containing protein n=1 Tax=Microbacterium sp. TaxID=51671 RepID=UPI00260CE550|nr:DUF4238 domain-containing protein [Microbacterium sp.]